MTNEEITALLDGKLADVLARIERLERDSHPPVALPIEAMQRSLDRIEERLASLDRRWPFKEFTPVETSRVNELADQAAGLREQIRENQERLAEPRWLQEESTNAEESTNKEGPPLQLKPAVCQVCDTEIDETERLFGSTPKHGLGNYHPNCYVANLGEQPRRYKLGDELPDKK